METATTCSLLGAYLPQPQSSLTLPSPSTFDGGSYRAVYTVNGKELSQTVQVSRLSSALGRGILKPTAVFTVTPCPPRVLEGMEGLDSEPKLFSLKSGMGRG